MSACATRASVYVLLVSNTDVRGESKCFARAPSVLLLFPLCVCGVNVGGLLCGTSIESIESIKSIESIESVESSDSIESIESTQSIEPIESIEF